MADGKTGTKNTETQSGVQQRRDMKFISGSLAGLLIGTAIFIGLVSLTVGRSTVETMGLAAMAASKIEIAKKTDRPKLLFVGGSSVDLGISAKIAENLLRRPAVNMGLIAPLGISYLTSRAKHAAGRGDVVVLIPEYGLYDWSGLSELWLDPMFIPYIVAQDPTYFRSLPWWYRANILARVSNPHLATVLLRDLKGKSAAITNMNNHGDRTDNTREKRPENAPARTKPLDQLMNGLSSSPKGLGALREFVAWANQNGVRVVATFPNVSRHSAYKKETLEAVERQITAIYDSLDVPVIGSLQAAMFAEEDCFDTHYHLIGPAVEKRTAELCELLKPHLLFHGTSPH